MSNLSELGQAAAARLQQFFGTYPNKELSLEELKKAREEAARNDSLKQPAVDAFTSLIGTFGATLDSGEVDSFVQSIDSLDGTDGNGIPVPSESKSVDQFSSEEKQSYMAFDTIFRFDDGSNQFNINSDRAKTILGLDEQYGTGDDSRDSLQINKAIIDNSSTFIVDSPTTLGVDNLTISSSEATVNENGDNGSSLSLSFQIQNSRVETSLSDFDGSDITMFVKINGKAEPFTIPVLADGFEQNANKLETSLSFVNLRNYLGLTNDGGATNISKIEIGLGTGTTAPSSYQEISLPNPLTVNHATPESTEETTETTANPATIQDSNLNADALPSSIVEADRAGRLEALTGYFDAHKSQFAELGITDQTDISNNTKLTQFLNQIYEVAGLKSELANEDRDSSAIPPTDLLKSEYRTRVLDALSFLIGQEGLEANQEKLAELLTTDSVDGSRFIQNYLTANFDSKDGVALTEQGRTYNGFRGVPRNLNSKQLASLNEQRNAIGSLIGENSPTFEAKRAGAKAWLEMYSVGVGGRNPAVIPNGKVSGTGNASVHKNLPAFAVRWLISEVSTFENSEIGIKALLNDVAGINVEQLQVPVKSSIESVIERIIELEDSEARNIFAGLLATSTVDVQPSSDRKIEAKIDVRNMLNRFIAHFANDIPARDQIVNQLIEQLEGVEDGVKTVEFTLNETQWDNAANADGSTALIIMDELFNTTNNPNNISGKQPNILQESIETVGDNSTVNVSNNPVYQAIDVNGLEGITSNTAAIAELNLAENDFVAGELTENQATQLVGTWLKAKNTVFDNSSDNRVELVNRFTVGAYRESILNDDADAIAFDQKIEYQNQNIISVSDFEKNGDEYTAAVEIYEDKKFNEDTNDRRSGQYRQTVKYTFTKDVDNWKISGYEPQPSSLFNQPITESGTDRR